MHIRIGGRGMAEGDLEDTDAFGTVDDREPPLLAAHFAAGDAGGGADAVGARPTMVPSIGIGSGAARIAGTLANKSIWL
ncbi:hypothetical protein ACQP00_21495 [Dactylosporangium sp. CS-047395]|uniref:hypothetical protein n=1 Tax=Dactylosporangium sp. CS-047395 TaxID=3239936 RepID=UPI003D8ACD52